MSDSNDYETQAVMALLEAARKEVFGIAFLPDYGDEEEGKDGTFEHGWQIAYISLVDWPAIHDKDLPAGMLSTAYDLETAAKAALKPLRLLGGDLKEWAHDHED